MVGTIEEPLLRGTSNLVAMGTDSKRVGAVRDEVGEQKFPVRKDRHDREKNDREDIELEWETEAVR
jgi:hypothetical protein